jgi:hypothetical protein
MHEIHELIKAAVECSVYISPNDFGLSREELAEIGKRAGYLEGELSDALDGAVQFVERDWERFIPRLPMLSQFILQYDPEYRNLEAFEFVHTQLLDLVRSQGKAQAVIERAVLLERARQSGLRAHDVEVAITLMLLDQHLVEVDGLRFGSNRETFPSPKAQAKSSGGAGAHKAVRVKAYALVKDVLARRSDGRPRSAESFDVFAEALEKLGYGKFRLWWIQLVSELRTAEPSASPVSCAVLSAALVEGALTFAATHARKSGFAIFGSNSFEKPPNTWKIDDLVASATTGRANAILDAGIRHRADSLIRTRQRIHAGRMLADFPQGPPDLRPEEARDAKATAELVVRRVCDWLEMPNQ